MIFDWADMRGADQAIVQDRDAVLSASTHQAAPSLAWRQRAAPLAYAAAIPAALDRFYKLGQTHA
jgi:hypothetical protein